MSRTLTVEGDLAAVDTKNILSTQGSNTAPSTVVPQGMTKISQIMVSAAAEALADGAATFFIRFGGNAVKNGQQTLVVSAQGRIAPQSGSDSAPAICPPIMFDNVDIPVSSGDTIEISAEMAGTDLGTGRAVVTVIFT